MNCRQIQQNLSLYMDKELGSDQTKLIEEHLQECPACTQYYRSLKATKQCCGDLNVMDLPLGFHEKLHQRLIGEERKQMPGRFKFKIAAGIVAALLLIFVGISLSNDVIPKKQIAYDTDANESAPSYGGAGVDESRIGITSTEDMADRDVADQFIYESEKAPEDGGFSTEGELQEEASLPQEEAGHSVQNQSSAERKIIRSAYLSAETLEFDRFVNTITGKLNSVGGYIESSNVDGIPRNAQSGTLRKARFEIRVPKRYFQQFITDVGELGNFLTKQENGEDITGKYFDTEARLKSLQIQEERLLTILRKAEKLQDIIELERELSNVRYEIENLTGTLKKWDNMVEYSCITLDVYEVKELKEEEFQELTWGQRIAEGFTNSLEELVDFSKDLIVFLASALPYFVVVGVFGWIVWKLVKWYGFFTKSRKKGDEEND